jgi:hypothetical protein
VYRTIEIPQDLSTDSEERGQLAFLNAEETMHDFVLPATWRVVWDKGEHVRVVRESARLRPPTPRGPKRAIVATYFDGSKSTPTHYFHSEVLECGHNFAADDRRHNPAADSRYCTECLKPQGPIENARATWNLKNNVH